MSKRFAKILTICSLILVFAATIVGSALCLSTVYAFDVMVDTKIDNNDLGFASAKVLINGEETNKVKVKKNSEVTISFRYDDENCTNGRIYAGDKSSYANGEALEVKTQGNEVTYKTKVTDNMNFTVLHDAYTFNKLTVSYEAFDASGAAAKDVDGKISVGVDKYQSTNVQEKDGYIYAQNGTQVVLTHKVADGLPYDFSEWKGATGIENDRFTITSDAQIVGTFREFESYKVTINVIYDVDYKDVNGATESVISVIKNDADKVTHDSSSNVWSVRKNAGSVTFEAKAGTGYKLAGWGTTQDANSSTSTTYSPEQLTSDKTIYVKFTVLKCNVTYKTQNATGEEQTETASVNYGTALNAGEDYYKDGWNKFTGWKCEETDYKAGDRLTFGTDGTSYTFVAQYKEQKNAKYNITVKDAANNKTMAYDTTNGFGSAQTLPTHARSFYKLAGIKLNGVVYKTTDSTFTAGAEIKQQFDAALAELGMEGTVEVEVGGVWEWTFTSLKYSWTLGQETDEEVVEKNTMLSTISLKEIIDAALGGQQFRMITVSFTGTNVTDSGSHIITSAHYGEYTLEGVLEMLSTINENAEITINFTITAA